MSSKALFRVAAASLLAIAAVPSSAAAQSPANKQSVSGTVAGVVSIVDPAGQPLVVPGVTLTLTCGADAPTTQVSDDQGAFRFDDAHSADGSCSITADLQGFKSAASVVRLNTTDATALSLRLGLDTLHEEVTVSAPDTSSETTNAARIERVTAQEFRSAPIASERFQAALPLIPGVVRGPDGLLNVSGARSNQAGLLFNSTNGTDPVTGEDAIELPIDAVRSVQVRGAAYAPEFGLSTGAQTLVETHRAGDSWHFTLNDLEPRVRRRGGEFRGIESFTPRVTVGGPIEPGKLFLLHSMQYEYSQTQVFGLPPLESDVKLQSFASYTRTDWRMNPTSELTGSIMVSPRQTTHAGLNTLNPQPVTPNIRNNNVFGSAAHQFVAGDRGVLETRVSVKQFDSRIYPSEGNGPMVLAPDVNEGSYFNDEDRTSRRFEWTSTYSFTPLGQTHLMKVGVGAARESYDGTSISRPIEILRADGTRSQQIAFTGDGVLGRSSNRVQGFAQDDWTVAPRLTLQYGGRYDYQSIVGTFNLAPRGSLTALLTPDGRTVLRAGIGLFYNVLPLNVATFDQLQSRVLTTYDGAGQLIAPPLVLPNLVADRLRAPRSVNGSVEIDREWAKNLFVRVGYRERSNRFDPTVDVAPDATLLRTDGEARYREGQVSMRVTWRTSDQLVAAYTRSSAIGNLNDFNSYFGNIENPVIRSDSRGPLPWDAPNRVLFWANVSLPYDFTVFPVVDIRSGFPLSNLDADRNFVGPRNEVGRFPTFFSLDTQITKKFRLFDHNATIGLKIFNLTDHFNPRDYQGNLASTAFGDFNNSVGRTFRGKWVFEF